MTETPKPYAAATTDYLGCEYISLDIEGIEKIAAAGSQGPTDVVYLYAGSPPPPPLLVGWQSMETDPKNGKHCILAIKSGAFVYSIQGSFANGKWLNAADIDSEPLAWMPNVRLPAEFCPLTDEYRARAALSAPEAEKNVGFVGGVRFNLDGTYEFEEDGQFPSPLKTGGAE